jgi:hypothetical protein
MLCLSVLLCRVNYIWIVDIEIITIITYVKVFLRVYPFLASLTTTKSLPTTEIHKSVLEVYAMGERSIRRKYELGAVPFLQTTAAISSNVVGSNIKHLRKNNS